MKGFTAAWLRSAVTFELLPQINKSHGWKNSPGWWRSWRRTSGGTSPSSSCWASLPPRAERGERGQAAGSAVSRGARSCRQRDQAFLGDFWELPAEIPPLELPLRWNNGTLEVCRGAGWQGSGRAAKKKRGWVLKTGVFKDCASRGAAGRAGRGAGCEESVLAARASPLQSSRAEPCQKHSSPSPSSGELTG